VTAGVAIGEESVVGGGGCWSLGGTRGREAQARGDNAG